MLTKIGRRMGLLHFRVLTALAAAAAAAAAVALVAGLALSTEPAEAGVFTGDQNTGGGSHGSGGGGTPPPRPANDNFSAAMSLPWLQDGYHNGTTLYAGLESGEPTPSSCGGPPVRIYNTVWYKITPTYTGTVTFAPSSSNFDAVLTLYTGSSLTSLQGLKCFYTVRGQRNPMTTQVQAGQTYYLQLSGNEGYWGSFSLQVDWGSYYCSECQSAVAS